MKHKFNKAFWLGVITTEAYRFYKGAGIFNKPRFSKEHEVLLRYVEANYPGARYTPIKMLGDGFASVIKTTGQNIPIYFYKAENGVYIFKEGEMV